MKSWHIGIAVGVLIWLMAALGWAQQSAPPPTPERGLLAVLDADGDGALSPAEQSAAPARLRALDADGDGTLTREELPWSAPARLGSLRRSRASMMRSFEPMRWRRMARFWPRFFGGVPWTSRSRGIGRPWSGDTSAGSWQRRGGAAGDGGSDGAGRMQTALFERFDDAGDGYLDVDKVPGRIWLRLQLADADEDGRVTPEELGVRAEKMRERMQELSQRRGRSRQ